MVSLCRQLKWSFSTKRSSQRLSHEFTHFTFVIQGKWKCQKMTLKWQHWFLVGFLYWVLINNMICFLVKIDPSDPKPDSFRLCKQSGSFLGVSLLQQFILCKKRKTTLKTNTLHLDPLLRDSPKRYCNIWRSQSLLFTMKDECWLLVMLHKLSIPIPPSPSFPLNPL